MTVLALAFAATRFAMTTDTTALVSPDEPWRVAERRMDAAFPGNGDVIVVVIDGRTAELAQAAAAMLAARLGGDREHVRSLTRPDGGDFFAREGLLFGTRTDVEAAAQAMVEAQPFLGPLAADPSLRGVATTIGTFASGVETGNATLDRFARPMRALGSALDARAAGRPAFFSWQALIGAGGGIAAPTRQLLLVRPVLDHAALMPGAAASNAIRAAAAAGGLDPAHGVRIRLTGATPLEDEEFGSLAENWWVVAGAMLAAMLLTLRWATRSWRVVAAILVTTLAGLAITVALGLAAVGRLTLISIAFIPLFVGLGIDFGIQIGVRFQAERHDGATPRAAIGAAVSALSRQLLLAAAAICLGFLAFLPTAYVGIAELGVIAAIGMALALALAVTLLPALLVLLPPASPRAELGSRVLAPADAALHRHRRPVLWAFALAMGLSIAALPFVRFDFDPLHLRAPDGEAMSALADLARDPARNPNTIELLAPSLPAAQALAARLDALPEVGQSVTLASFVPADQPAKLAAIGNARDLLAFSLDPFAPLPPPSDAETVAALRTAADTLDRAAARGDAAAADARRLATAFRKLAAGTPDARAAAAAMLIRPLGVMLDAIRAALSAAPVTIASLPPDLTASWIAPDGRARISLTPAKGDTDAAGLRRFVAAVQAIAPGATGAAVSTQGAARTIAGAFIVGGVLALAAISALLFAVLRDAREVAFTLAPVVLSGFLTLGTCVVIGQPINFANIIAFPLLFGVGVAFHIYFVMAWRDGEDALLQSPLARAIFFSAMATGTAFGSLWLSHHPGTASMGKLLMISLAWTLICALIFEPALLGPVTSKPNRAARAS